MAFKSKGHADLADAFAEAYFQAAGDEELFVAGRRSIVLELVRLAVAVTITNAGIFLADVQGIHQTAGSQNAKCLAVEIVESAGRDESAIEHDEAG